MKNKYIQLVPADLSLAEQVVDYYKRNRDFLEAFEPVRNKEFFSLEYQQEVLKREMFEYEEKIENVNICAVGKHPKFLNASLASTAVIAMN